MEYCATKSLQLDPSQRFAGYNPEKKGRGKKGNGVSEEAAVIYCTMNSPGTTALAGGQREKHSFLYCFQHL